MNKMSKETGHHWEMLGNKLIILKLINEESGIYTDFLILTIKLVNHIWDEVNFPFIEIFIW